MTTIFMIEDNPLDVELMTMSLTESGLACTVQVADDGERGVQLLEQAGVTVPLPALILLDLNIPRISGLEVLAVGRANPALRDLPIVVLSGSLNPRDAEAAMHRAKELGVPGEIGVAVSRPAIPPPRPLRIGVEVDPPELGQHHRFALSR